MRVLIERVRLAKVTIVLALLSGLLFGQTSPVRLGTESRKTVRALSLSGLVDLTAVVVQVRIYYQTGAEPGELVILYHSQNGHYLWFYRTGGDEPLYPSQAVYDSTSGLLLLVVSGGPATQLSELQSDERAVDLAAAERASVAALESRLAEKNKKPFDQYRRLETATALGHLGCPMLDDPFLADWCGPNPTIADVSLNGGNWRVVLHNRWDQEIIFDSEFKMTSTRRLPPSAR